MPGLGQGFRASNFGFKNSPALAKKSEPRIPVRCLEDGSGLHSELDFTSGLDIALFFRLRHHFPRNLPQVPFGG